MDVEDRANEPEERQSATIEDMVDVDKKKVKRKAKVISKEVQLEKNVQWAFEHPAEALFVGMSSALSQKHPEVKKRVFDLINKIHHIFFCFVHPLYVYQLNRYSHHNNP